LKQQQQKRDEQQQQSDSQQQKLKQETRMSESKVLVEIDYADVMKEPSMVKDTLGKTLASAFQNGEMVAMRNVPGYVESSRKVLPMAYKLAKLPEETKASLTSEESHWQAGWNQGKVMLNKKVMDPKKASFYFNPLTDSPATPEEREMYPTVFPVNVWPSEDDMPGFQGEAKLLGRIMHNALVQFAKHVDAYVFEQCGVELATGRSNVYSKEVIHKAVRKTEKGKCRLLYYSPFSDEEAEAIKKEEEKNGQDNDGLMWNGKSILVFRVKHTISDYSLCSMRESIMKYQCSRI
jgi:hypothetical protein